MPNQKRSLSIGSEGLLDKLQQEFTSALPNSPEDQRQRVRHEAAARAARLACAEGPPVGGLLNFKFSSGRHPRKFGVHYFLVRKVARAEWDSLFLGYLLGKNFRRRDRGSSPAQKDGCSSLPCRDVLSFRSAAREALGSETGYRNVNPPSTTRLWPVMKAAS